MHQFSASREYFVFLLLDACGVFERIRSVELCEALFGCPDGLLAVGESPVEVLGFLFVVVIDGRSGGVVGIPVTAVAEASPAGGSLFDDLISEEATNETV